MSFLPSSGVMSLTDVSSLFGGPASPSLSDYYRGGTYVPSSKVVSTMVYEPPDGNVYNGVVPVSDGGYWWVSNLYKGVWFTFNAKTIWWNDVQIASNVDASLTSITIGSYTYYKSNYIAYQNFNTNGYVYEYGYAVRRTSGGSSTVTINAGVPASGTFSLSQLYGAEKP